MRHLTLIHLFLPVLLLSGCSSQPPREAFSPAQVAAAAHYRQYGDAAALRIIAALLHPGLRRDDILKLLGPPVYSPTDHQDYYSSELQDENHFTLTLVVNYHPATSTQAETVEWFFLDYIGE